MEKGVAQAQHSSREMFDSAADISIILIKARAYQTGIRAFIY